jgi:hypothetical protein
MPSDHETLNQHTAKKTTNRKASKKSLLNKGPEKEERLTFDKQGRVGLKRLRKFLLDNSGYVNVKGNVFDEFVSL